GGRVTFHDVVPDTGARDTAALLHLRDGLGADMGILHHDGCGVAHHGTQLVLALGLGRHQGEAGAFDEPALDVALAEVIVGDDHLELVARRIGRSPMAAPGVHAYAPAE